MFMCALLECTKVMHGPETVQVLRNQLGYRGVIIGLTGNAMSEDVSSFKSSGLDEILFKPVKRQGLLDALRKTKVIPEENGKIF